MPNLSPDEVRLLSAVLDRIVPPDDFPGAVDAGVLDHVQRLFAEFPQLVDVYRAGLIVLQTRAFEALSFEDRDAALNELEGHPSIAAMTVHAQEGYYAGIESVGARMVGFRVTA